MVLHDEGDEGDNGGYNTNADNNGIGSSDNDCNMMVIVNVKI